MYCSFHWQIYLCRYLLTFLRVKSIALEKHYQVALLRKHHQVALLKEHYQVALVRMELNI